MIMNERFKFRCYDKIQKQMCYEIAERTFDLENGENHDNEYSLLDALLYTPEEYILMQWAGLKDNFNKDIYESDYVKDDENFVYIVFWDEDNLQWRIKDIFNNDIMALCEFKNNDLLIVGNIYENHELMEIK
jgi:hypothetical protein